jgi:hypothetical protein
MKRQKFIVRFPKTIEEICIWGFYIPMCFVSVLGVLGAAFIGLSLFIPEMRLDLNNGWTFVLIFCATYFFNETVFNYLRFPYFLFTQDMIFGISIFMGIPMPFLVYLDNIDSVEEIYFPYSPYFLWVVKLKKQKWHQFWMRKRFYISPYIKEHEKFILLIKQGL